MNNMKYLLSPFKWMWRQFGHLWCMFIHGFILDKHKMHKRYGPEECQICGRWWKDC